MTPHRAACREGNLVDIIGARPITRRCERPAGDKRRMDADSAKMRQVSSRHSPRPVMARRGPARARVVALDGYSATPANDIRLTPIFKAGGPVPAAIRLKLTFARVDDDVAIAELSRILKRMVGGRAEG